jgi:hypothetical protein
MSANRKKNQMKKLRINKAILLQQGYLIPGLTGISNGPYDA